MPVPKTHYRVALGEYGGQHSWVVQSAKGLEWNNIPGDLENLLRTIATHDVLDFSLGSKGRYYVKFLSGGREKRSEQA
ncbi:hypothetical protein FS837_011725 [Tulasnella sp. UAMH 9824]|nr:hypothetical protein FS837_011725 [Tulasnella sp. UAMH 9824]